MQQKPIASIMISVFHDTAGTAPRYQGWDGSLPLKFFETSLANDHTEEISGISVLIQSL